MSLCASLLYIHPNASSRWAKQISKSRVQNKHQQQRNRITIIQ
jgi:hypothetical protein